MTPTDLPHSLPHRLPHDLSANLTDRGTTVFERMSALARATDAINLGQGFPDMVEPPELLAAAQHALVAHGNQYPPMRGLPDLHRAIAAWYRAEQGLDIADAEIVVTSGATEALAAAILAVINPGDEAILVQPLYDAYLPLIARAGGTVRLVDLSPPDWQLSVEAIERAIGPRTRLLLINTPNNPTGTVIDCATLHAIGDLCARHDILLISDEVWESTLLDGSSHASPFHVPALRERTIKIGSAGKIFSLTGWKVGWAIAAPRLADAVARQHQFLTFTTATPLQRAVAEGLALPGDWFVRHRAGYANARARLVTGLRAAGYVILPANGSWFVTVDLSASGLPADDEAVADRLIQEAGIAAIPVSAFYAERAQRGYLRLCFAKRDAMLDEAIARLTGFRERCT